MEIHVAVLVPVEVCVVPMKGHGVSSEGSCAFIQLILVIQLLGCHAVKIPSCSD